MCGWESVITEGVRHPSCEAVAVSFVLPGMPDAHAMACCRTEGLGQLGAKVPHPASVAHSAAGLSCLMGRGSWFGQ